ncbi:MAG: response regulator [Ignavibacteria bacterium]|nr:response regulator [Ignavibacteria bacterium]
MITQSEQYKILVIDDRPDNVYYLQSRLQHENFLVLTAFSGKDGIEKAKGEKPDLILLDIMMPVMDGFEVCRQLSKDTSTALIPIILVTAKVDAKDVEEGLKVGAFDYIKKPFDKVELIARINSAIRFAEYQQRAIRNEKYQIYEATVVTANHEIKQPLTLMSLALNAVKRELNKKDLSKKVLEEKVALIDEGITTITSILNKLNALKNPALSAYDREIKMIDFNDLTKKTSS